MKYLTLAQDELRSEAFNLTNLYPAGRLFQVADRGAQTELIIALTESEPFVTRRCTLVEDRARL